MLDLDQLHTLLHHLEAGGHLMKPAEIAKLKIEAWKLAKAQLAAAALGLAPVEDVEIIKLINEARAQLQKKIEAAGGT